MKPGDTVHVPSPEKSNHQWTVYDTATVVSVDGELVMVSPAGAPDTRRVVQREELMTALEFQAYLVGVRGGGA